MTVCGRSLIIFLYFFNLLIATQIHFDKVSDEETFKVKNHILSFYSHELFKSGLFQDDTLAFEAAKEECLQDTIDHPEKCYFYINSNEFEDTNCSYIVYSIDQETAYLDAIYLDQKYRGRDFGKSALCHLESELRNKGIKEIKLYVFAHNQVAFGLYTKMGYVIESSYFNNALPIGYHMKKAIDTNCRDNTQ